MHTHMRFASTYPTNLKRSYQIPTFLPNRPWDGGQAWSSPCSMSTSPSLSEAKAVCRFDCSFLSLSHDSSAYFKLLFCICWLLFFLKSNIFKFQDLGQKSQNYIYLSIYLYHYHTRRNGCRFSSLLSSYHHLA